MTDTSTIAVPLEVIGKYRALVEESLNGTSVYIRAKETMESLFQDGDINSTDKAQAISTTVTSMVTAITNSSMATALSESVSL